MVFAIPASNNKESAVSYIVWYDLLNTGIREIDDQHQEMARIVSELHEFMVLGSSIKAVDTALEELVRQTAAHFQTEHKLMLEYKYPDREAHEREHEELTTRLADIKKRLNAGQAALTLDVLDYLKDWLLWHIRDRDIPFGRFVRDRIPRASF